MSERMKPERLVKLEAHLAKFTNHYASELLQALKSEREKVEELEAEKKEFEEILKTSIPSRVRELEGDIQIWKRDNIALSVRIKELEAFKQMVEGLDILTTSDVANIAKEDDTICFVCWDELHVKAEELQALIEKEKDSA